MVVVVALEDDALGVVDLGRAIRAGADRVKAFFLRRSRLMLRQDRRHIGEARQIVGRRLRGMNADLVVADLLDLVDPAPILLEA